MARNNYTPVRLNASERAALEAAARARGETVSEAMRRAIKAQYLDPARKNEGHAVVYEAAGAPLLVQS